MFSFLNRNKAQNVLPPKTDELILDIDDAKKNLYDSIVLRRTDIVVSLMNEWFKGIHLYFFSPQKTKT